MPPALHAVARANTVAAEGEEEEEEEEEEEGSVGGASLEKNAKLQPPPYEEEGEGEGEGEDQDVGGDAGLQNRSPVRPGPASSPIQPCHLDRNTSSGASGVFHHSVDAEGHSACQALPLPPSPPDLGSSNTMDVDKAGCSPPDVLLPTDSIGSIEAVVAAAHHRGHGYGFQEATSDATPHGTDERGINPSAVLASQTSSEPQCDTLAHPDSESSMDLDVASIGESQAGGSDKAHAGEDAMDVDGTHDVEPREPPPTSGTGGPGLRRSSRDRNPVSDNKNNKPAATNSRKRSKKRATKRNPSKPKDALVTVMEEADGGFREAILVDITIDELQSDIVSTLNCNACVQTAVIFVTDSGPAEVSGGSVFGICRVLYIPDLDHC
jgi:hypothetical protein